MRALRHRVNVALWDARVEVARAARTAATWGVLIAVALGERTRAGWRRLLRRRPRLVWGPQSLMNIKYWSAAMRERGWESTTGVVTLTRIAKPGDFDVHREELEANSRLPDWLKPYAFFIWALRRGDVHISNFDGGFLVLTPLAYKEHLFRRLAGKRLIAWPYGSDVALVGHMGEWEGAFREDYPELIESAELIERRIRYTARHAAAVIRSKQVGFVPNNDVEWASQLAIDVDHWGHSKPPTANDGRNGPVTVMHAPNHRALKGTQFLIEAVESLRRDGLDVELQLLERRTNEEIRTALFEADIAGDQFTGGGYALFALEAMTAGKPVLSGITGDPHFTDLLVERGCPVVDTNPERLESDLRRLVTDPPLRRRLGEAGRGFVARHHSYEAIAADWEAVIDFAWRGTALPPSLRPR